MRPTIEELPNQPTVLGYDGIHRTGRVSKSGDYERWLAARHDCLTGSRAYVEAGLSPFPETDWDDPPPSVTRRMLVGSLMEGAIASDPDLQAQWRLLWPGAEFVWNGDDWFFRHSQYAQIGATPDVLVFIDGKVVGVVELKFQSTRWSSEYPPQHYLLQAALTAEVMGAPTYALSCWYPAMNSFWYQTLPPYAPLTERKGQPYAVKDLRMPDGQTGIKDLCRRWVEEGTLNKAWADYADGKEHDDGSWEVEANQELQGLLESYAEVNAGYNAAGKTRKALRESILDAAWNAQDDVTILHPSGDRLATIKTTEAYRFYDKDLAEDNPELHAEYYRKAPRTTLKVL